MSSDVRTWLIKRAYLDDKRNVIILVCATSDRMRYHRKECSLTSLESDMCDAYATVDMPENELGHVADEETRESYAVAVTEMAESRELTDTA